MQPPNFAPPYVAMFKVLSDLARDHGYALAVHGSVARDFDLVAIPWTDSAVKADVLVQVIAERCYLCYGIFGTGLIGPEVKPHGRLAWSLMIGSGSMIDLSVMPLSVVDDDDTQISGDSTSA